MKENGRSCCATSYLERDPSFNDKGRREGHERRKGNMKGQVNRMGRDWSRTTCICCVINKGTVSKVGQ